MLLPKAKATSHMPRFSLAILELLLLLLLRCRLCAARNDPGGRQAAGVHLPTWKLCLVVALPVATVALLAALIVFACRRRHQNAPVVAVAPAAQNQWSAHLWSSAKSPRNPMSINPTMVRSTENSPSGYYRPARVLAGPASPSPRRDRPPAQVASPLRPGPRPPAQAASTVVRTDPPALVWANLKQETVIQDPLACYSPAFWVRLTHLDYDQLQPATNELKTKSLPGGRVGPWNVVLKGTQIVLDKGLPAKVTIKRHHSTFTEEDCKRIREELKCKSTLRHMNLVKLHGYTIDKGRLYLVYDYMSKGSLEDHLFPVNGAPVLDWVSRFRIAKEVAQGLDPLHVCNAPHGSISVSSIMLDHDYYIARLDDHFYYRPDISSSSKAIASTSKSKKNTSKTAETGASLEADIADLGAVFLELVCGRRRTDTDFSRNGNMTLVEWVWALYGEAYKKPNNLNEDMQLQRRVNEERLFGAVDRRLDGEINKAQASKLLILGLACSHPDSKLRLKIRDVRNVLLDKDPVPQLPLSKPKCK